MSILYSSYTYDLLKSVVTTVKGSQTETDTAVDEGVRCHFREDSEVIRTSSDAQKSPDIQGRLQVAAKDVKPTAIPERGDYLIVYVEGSKMGKFIIDTVHPNKFVNGRLDSYTLSIHSV